MTARTREETAVEFASAMGWKYVPFVPRLASEPCGSFGVLHPPGPNARIAMEMRLPPTDAPLPDALAFVGHVAEAMPDGFVRTFFAHVGDDWTDLSHAAMLVAISAKRGAL